jgi:UDP-4-amino-4,6-dideoxy-N-acetyl-beta-L-altrosamine N-acetyltransferase
MISLRGIRPADQQQLLVWRNRPDVRRYMYSDHLISPQEHEEWFTAALTDPSRDYWVINMDGENVGLANLYAKSEAHKRCYWAFYLASENVRGKGVGSFTEWWVLHHVFERLGYNRLCCEVLASNQPVITMHKSFGFTEEGRFREHVLKDGVPQDVIALAMLRGDWLQLKTDIAERLRGKGLIP